MTDKNNNIENLLPLYFEGKLAEDQKQIVEEWMNSSESNQSIADDIADLYRTTDTLFAVNSADTDAALSSIHGEMRKAVIASLTLKIQRIAAILFIPLLFVSLLQFFNNRSDAQKMVSIKTNPGMTAKATLPDGTEVTLGSNTSLSYPNDFSDDERKVSLSGEAYFDVAKDADRPFIVGTPQKADVKVYGTQFNVEAYPESGNIIATLEEGSVAVRYHDAGDAVREQMIVPGESATYTAATHSLAVAKADVEVVTSWKEGRLIFRNTPVKEVLHTLSKRFDVDFVVKNDKVYENSFTGTLEKQRLDRVLEYIGLTSNIRFRYVHDADINKNNQTIEVYQ